MELDTIYFKIHGGRRTGTNYITSLLIDNFTNVKCIMNLGGGKHKIINYYPTMEQLKKLQNVNIILNIYLIYIKITK